MTIKMSLKICFISYGQIKKDCVSTQCFHIFAEHLLFFSPFKRLFAKIYHRIARRVAMLPGTFGFCGSYQHREQSSLMWYVLCGMLVYTLFENQDSMVCNLPCIISEPSSMYNFIEHFYLHLLQQVQSQQLKKMIRSQFNLGSGQKQER